MVTLVSRLAVEIVGWLDAAHPPKCRRGKIGILDAGSDSHLPGIGIVDDINAPEGRNAEIAKLSIAGIDDLVRFGAGRSGDNVSGAKWDDLVAPASPSPETMKKSSSAT
jgi:hypothetical protein